MRIWRKGRWLCTAEETLRWTGIVARVSTDAWKHVAAKDVDEALLLRADLMQMDAVEAARQVTLDPIDVFPQVR